MKIRGNTVGTTMKRPDFKQTDPKKSDFIRNNPIPKLTEADEGKCVVVKGGKYALGALLPDGSVVTNGGDIKDVLELPTTDISSTAFYRLLTVTFIHNRHPVENSICYPVDGLPMVGEPATDLTLSQIRAYYNLQDNAIYGYIGETLSSALGLSVGWYPAAPLLQVAGYSYDGIINDIEDDPKDSVIRALLQYDIYSYKDGKWTKLSNIDVSEWIRPPHLLGAGHWIYAYNKNNLENPFPAALLSSHSINTEFEDQVPVRHNGIIKTADPVENDDCANKKYVNISAALEASYAKQHAERLNLDMKSYVENLTNGASKAVSYGNYSTLILALRTMAATVYNVGQNIMIVTLHVPDLWVSEVCETHSTYTYTTDEAFVSELLTNGFVKVGYYKLSALETQKVDLTEYVKTDDIQNGSVVAKNATIAQYASADTSKGTIEERLTALGFKSGVVTVTSEYSDYVHFPINTLTRQGNYVIGKLRVACKDTGARFMMYQNREDIVGKIESVFCPKKAFTQLTMFRGYSGNGKPNAYQDDIATVHTNVHTIGFIKIDTNGDVILHFNDNAQPGFDYFHSHVEITIGYEAAPIT